MTKGAKDTSVVFVSKTTSLPAHCWLLAPEPILTQLLTTVTCDMLL